MTVTLHRQTPAQIRPRLCSLADLRPGQAGQIVSIDAEGPIRRRLLEMGFTHDTTVTVLRTAPLGDPVEYRLRHYSVSLRRHQARFIQVAVDAGNEKPAHAALPPPEPIAAAPTDIRTVALLGNPNCGKTSVFNRLTGLRQKVANFAGVTVEKKIGLCRVDDRDLTIIDLPGTYSLSPIAPDERIARQVVACEQPDVPPPDAVVVIADASCLERHLLLFSQLMDYGLPCVLALNKVDIAKRIGLSIDTAALEAHLGVPVVAVSAHTGAGITELRAALPQARPPRSRPWTLPTSLVAATDDLASQLPELLPETRHHRLVAERLLCQADSLLRFAHSGDERLPVAVERARRLLDAAGVDPVCADIESRYAWIDSLIPAAVRSVDGDGGEDRRFSERFDRVLIHPVWGLGIFGLIMAAVFYTVFAVAEPLMGWCEEGVAALGTWVTGALADGPLKDLLLDGVIAGVGGVLVFIPQIALLFGILAILEDSGYLARAAFLMDRLLCRVGLHGKSFIPLLSSHACTIPGIMAARSIEHRSDRLVTMLVAPFMGCSARLPVYFLLITVFFGHWPTAGRSALLLGLYAAGIAAAAGTALLVRGTLFREASPAFLLEFPPYSRPQPIAVVRSMVINCGIFVRKAGTIILAFSILLWAALNYPQLDAAREQALAVEHGIDPTAVAEADEALRKAYDNALAGERVRGSLAGRFGRLIEPVIAPLGYDWKIGVGLVGAFAAREVFVSTMGIVYSVGDEADEESAGLHDAIRSDTRADGSPVWTTPVAISLLVWFAIALQCISTVAVMRRETGSWSWPLAQLAYMNGLAWILAFIAYRIGMGLS